MTLKQLCTYHGYKDIKHAARLIDRTPRTLLIWYKDPGKRVKMLEPLLRAHSQGEEAKRVKEVWIAQSPFCSANNVIEWSDPSCLGALFCEGKKEEYVYFKKYILIEVEINDQPMAVSERE